MSGILLEYDDLAARMSSTPNWSSVLDQMRFIFHGAAQSWPKSESNTADELIRHLEKLADSKGSAPPSPL